MESSFVRLIGAAFFALIIIYYFSCQKYPCSASLSLEQLKAKFAHEYKDILLSTVAHRGFHYANDNTRRPLENTLAAYEHAWSVGIRFCECDVQLTKDGEIVLSHDEDLRRLALNPIKITKTVKDSRFPELELTPLKDGSRVPKLIEVLGAAKRFGDGNDAKLIIEIKGDDLECVKSVNKVLASPLGENAMIVMGFSLSVVRQFAIVNPRKGQVLSMLLTVKTLSSNSEEERTFDLYNYSAILDDLKRSTIDGLYVEYDESFLRTPVKFQELCSKVPIGVWGINDIENAAQIVRTLTKLGAKFVNSDFGDKYFP